MRWPISPSGWMRTLALPLALWSALPGIQWCRAGWAQVRLECFAECSIERSECPASPCAAGAGEVGCTLPEGCAADAAERTPGPGDPRGGTPVGPPGGRAYCLSGPAGGDGLPPVTVQAAPAMAIVPAVMAGVAPATAARRPDDRVASEPPRPPAGAVPRIRAPPGVLATTC